MTTETKKWVLVALAIAAAVTFSLVSRLGGDGSADNSDPVPDDGPTADAVQVTRDVAVQVCEEFGPAATAREYGAPSDDLDAIARAYSMDSTAGPHRDAAYIGCLEGLMNY